MSKDKSQQPIIDKQKNTIEDIISKKFGDNILVSGNSIIDSPHMVIPVSPAIDLVLGGGIPEGSFVVLTSPPKLGKTATCLHFAGNAQQTEYDNKKFGPRHVYFFNIEGRIKARDLVGIKHLITDESRFTVIQSKPGKILVGEDYIDIGEKLINEKPGCVFIFDSFSALCTSEEYAADIGKRFRANAPLLLATFCRRISNVIPINQSIVMGITHVIANQGMGMSQWLEASGQKLKYQVDVKLKGTHYKAWTPGEVQIGQDINWECVTSAIGPPGGKCVSKFRYGYGLDKEAELVNICVDLGIIKKGGAWYSYEDEKAQGLEKMRNILVEKPKLFDKLNNQIREMMEM